MKVICKKRYSTVTNFIDGKEYECFHQYGKENLKVKWIKDEYNHWRCILPDERSPHLISVGPAKDCFGSPIQHSVGVFETSDHSPSRKAYIP